MKTDNNKSPEIVVPLGKALKEARLAASLSIDDVAEKLNLGACTVRDFEEDLSGILETKKYPVIYLRGYLANYAKLVNLNTLELFVEYQQLDSVKKNKNILTHSNVIIPPTKKRSKFLPVLLIIVITLSALLYLFNQPLLAVFKSNNSVSETNAVIVPVENKYKTIIIENIAQVTDKSESILADNSESQQEMLPKAKQLDSHKNAVQTLDNSEPIVEDIDPTIEVVEPIIEDVEVSTSISIEPEQQQVETSIDTFEATSSEPESVIEEVVKESVEEETLPVGPENISLAFNAECWTEVFDATGKRIAFGLYKNGRVLMLSGMAPFQLKLGDPSVVEIQYQDKIIEGEFTPGRSAQFSVPLS